MVEDDIVELRNGRYRCTYCRAVGSGSPVWRKRHEGGHCLQLEAKRKADRLAAVIEEDQAVGNADTTVKWLAQLAILVIVLLTLGSWADMHDPLAIWRNISAGFAGFAATNR